MHFSKHTFPSNSRMTLPNDLIASRIACHKTFPNPIGMIEVTASRLSGALPSECVQSPFIQKSDVEATQRGKRGKRRSYATSPLRWVFSLLFLLFFPSSVIALPRWLPTASAVTMFANQPMVSSSIFYVVRDRSVTWFVERFQVEFCNQISD